MHIHLLGGVDSPGASCLVVEASGRRVLIDAGVSATVDPQDLAARVAALGGLAAVVTHAHADHAGALPVVLSPFPQVPLVATPATLALLDLFFTDALRMFERQARSRGVEPPYMRRLVEGVLARSVPIAFGQRYPLMPGSVAGAGGWWLTFCRAGHVLGAAMVLLETPEGATNRGAESMPVSGTSVHKRMGV